MTKTFEKFKEEVEGQIRSLEADFEEKKRDYERMKSLREGTEIKLSELRAVLEEVSNKNDELEREKGIVKKKLDEEVIKTGRMGKDIKELENSISSIRLEHE